MQRFSPKASSVLEKKIFKGFYHIWAWRPSWSMDHDHFSNFSFPQPKEAPYEIWAKLAQGLQRRSRLKTDGQTDGRTDGRTDDGRKVITIAHPEHSSGELKMLPLGINSFHVHYKKQGYLNILKILPPKNENFRRKNSDIFHISVQNIDCGYSSEPPRRGGSNEYPQSMFSSRNKKK